MAEKHSSPDWFARGAATVGIIVSIVGLVLGYLNYRWQRQIQEENTAERILVHLDASRIGKLLRTEIRTELSFTPKGEVGLLVTNISSFKAHLDWGHPPFPEGTVGAGEEFPAS